MKERLGYIVIGAALLYYSVLRGVNALAVWLAKYEFVSVSLTQKTIRFRLYFAIKNPLLVGLKLRLIEGDVYVQGVKIGSTNMAYDYYLAGQKTHVIPVELECSMQGLTEAAITNLQTGDPRTLTISFVGHIGVGDSYVVRLPIEKTLNWEDLK